MTIQKKQAPIIEVFKMLIVAIKDFRLYGLEHDRTKFSVDNLVKEINSLQLDNSYFNIDRISEQWLILSYPVIELNRIGAELDAIFQQKEIARLSIDYPTNEKIVLSMIKFFLSSEKKSDNYKGFKVASVINNVAEQKIATDYKLARLTGEHQMAIDMRKIYNNYHHNKEVDISSVKEISRAFVQTFSVARNPLKFLADVKYEDEYTYVHTIDVALLSMGLAIAVGVPRHLLNDITFAALLHDVGKMMVPSEILNYPGKLEGKELAIMQSHALKGATYLAGHKDMPKVSVIVALEHHLNYDCGGYPDLGADYRPHIISQLISVADIYDALRSNRPYRKAMTNDVVLKIMREESGKKLNPQFVDIFINLVNHWQ